MISSRFLANKKLEAGVKARAKKTNDSENMDLWIARLLFEHDVCHVNPEAIHERVHERKAEENAQEAGKVSTEGHCLP